MRAAVAAVVMLLLGGAARAQEDDDPKTSTITEVGKPKPPPPAAQPKPPTQPAPPSTKPAAPSAKPAAPSTTAPAPTAPKTAPTAPATAPTGAQTPPAAKPGTSPSPDTASPSGVHEIVVPVGKTVEDVKPPGAITDTRKGIGEPIVEVKIIDNTKTDKNTVEYLANVKLGAILTPELIEETRQNLLSVGLFKEVLIYWEDAPGGGVRLVISAKDKLSWIIAPLFVYSAAEVGGGLAYAESNAFGQNKKFLVITEYTTVTKMLFAAWLDPQIRNTPFYYRVDLLLRDDLIREYAAGHTGNPLVERDTLLDTFGGAALLGVNFARKFHIDLRLKFYYDNAHSTNCYNTTNRDQSGTPDVVASQGRCFQPTNSGWDNTLTVDTGWDGRSNVFGVLHGLKVHFTYQYGATWLGDKASYHLFSGDGMYAWRFFKAHNLILKLGADVFLDPPFKQEVETGGTNMRGFLYRQYRGDTDVRATLEYHLPLFTVWGLSTRLVGFYDTNLTWFRSLPDQSSPLARFVVRDHGFRDFLPDTPSGVVRDSWHNGAGLGLRFFLKGVVLPLIGVDVAYGFEANDFQVYLALGSTLD